VELCDGLCHLTAGIKVTNLRVINPKDGSALSSIDDGVVGWIVRNQSRNYCFAVKSLLEKDSKDAYKEFKDFTFFEKIRKEGLPASKFGPAILSIAIWSPQDLNSLWK